MIDATQLALEFRGYPVTVISEGVAELLPGDYHAASESLLATLSSAQDTAEPDEPSGWIFESELAGKRIWIERFGGIRDLDRDRHEGGQWSVYLPSER